MVRQVEPHDVRVEIFAKTFFEPLEEHPVRLDRRQFQRQPVKPGYEFFVVGGNRDQGFQALLQRPVGVTKPFDLALDQGDGVAAAVVDFDVFKNIGVLFEKIRVLAQKVRDNFLERCNRFVHAVLF